jgi:hypothetical protein
MGEYNQLGKEISAKEALEILKKEYAETLKYFRKEEKPAQSKFVLEDDTPPAKKKRNSITDFEDWIDSAIDKTRGSTFY